MVNVANTEMTGYYGSAQVLGIMSVVISFTFAFIYHSSYYAYFAAPLVVIAFTVLFFETIPDELSVYAQPTTKLTVYLVATLISLPFIVPAILYFTTSVLYLLDYRKRSRLVLQN